MRIIELIQEFKNLGCTKDIICAVAARVFIDLKEVVCLENIEYHYELNFDMIYFKYLNSNGKLDIYIPVTSTTPLDLRQLEDFQNKLQIEEKIYNLKLAICDPSSTILYYRFKNGVDF